MYNDGMLVHEIAECIGCERTVVQRCLRRFNIDSFKNSVDRSKNPVSMCDNNESILKNFSSYSEAAQWLIDNGYSNANNGSIRTNIGRVVEGKRKTCCGFKWRNNPNW